MEKIADIAPITFNIRDLKVLGFKVYKLEATINPIPSYNRRDFYKVCIVSGKSLVHYAERSFELNGASLFFGNPRIPYSSELISREQKGYACLFTGDFLRANEHSESLMRSPLFKAGGTPVFSLDNNQQSFISSVFERMIDEQDGDYAFKGELIRDSIKLVIHEALKMEPAHNLLSHSGGPARITSVFFDLLERQFPIESPQIPLQLKTAQDYAKVLSVHVNHLNRSIKEVTGKSTTSHIADRVLREAKALLTHTDWSISEIAYGLGYEYPSYFNNFFKKMTDTNPTAFRK